MKATLLIVDDELPIRKLMTRFLEGAGYECFTAPDAESAKEALGAREFDLILTDLKMPGDSGLELIRHCKKHYPQVGRIMITGFGSPDVANEIMNVGVYGYVIKPLSQNVVLITVGNALRHLRLDQHMQAYRQELEKKVRRRSEKLVAIMDNLHAGVMMVNTDMEIMEFNQRMRHWFGDIQPGDRASCYQTVVDEEQEAICGDCPMAATLADGITNEVMRICSTSEGKKEFHIITTPIRDESGAIYAGLALYDDITEKMALERDLRQAQKLEAVGQLAAGIAHEINTPIQYVGDNISFLKESFEDIAGFLRVYERLWRQLQEDGAVPAELDRELTAEKERADLEYLWEEIPVTVNQSLEGVRRVNTIVRAMKDFSHPGDEEKSPMDINKMLESTITVCRNEWKYVAEMEKDFHQDLPAIPCLAGEISQVFLNIIVNAAHAIDAATDGGREGKGTITVQSDITKGGVAIRISDTGGGIPKNIRDRIFEPFFTTKTRGKGTGQGLAIAHRVVVEKHQGRLFLESEEGRGTTFIIELPEVEG